MEYHPLSLSRNEIRILSVLPASNPHELVTCKLSNISLNLAPSFKALSYCWGDPHITRSIRTNGCKKEVTINLHAALVHLRSSTHPVIMWIDSLCINQDDLEERSLQVSRMASIYRCASEVVAWLGPPLPGGVNPLKAMQDTDWLNLISKNLTVARAAKNLQKGIERLIFTRFSYWTRMWILQEVAVASRLVVTCGYHSIPWDLFCTNLRFSTEMDIPARGTAWENILDFEKSTPTLTEEAYCMFAKSLKAFETFQHFRSLVANSEPISLPEALQKSTKLMATDPRDKIYALLHLAYDGHTFVPVPTYDSLYKINLNDIITEMTKNYIKATRKLDVIVGHTRLDRYLTSLPSWTPDWVNMECSVEEKYGLIIPDRKKYNATGGVLCQMGTEIGNSNEIQVSGLQFDVIEGLSSVYGRNTRSKLGKGFEGIVQPTKVTGNPYLEGLLGHRSVRETHRTKGWFPPWIDPVKWAIWNCLDEGSSHGLDLLPTTSNEHHVALSFYYGCEAKPVAWWYRFFEQGFEKIAFSTDELSLWLEDNRELQIHGETFEHWCRYGKSWVFIFKDSICPLLETGIYIWVCFGVVACWKVLWQHGIPPSLLKSILSTQVALLWDVLSHSLLLYLLPVSLPQGIIVPTSYKHFMVELAVLLFVIRAIILWEFRQGVKSMDVKSGYLKNMDKHMKQRGSRLVITRSGYVGMCPPQARKGDSVFVIRGCTTPVLLRKFEKGYKVIGMVYIYDIMHGELMDLPNSRWRQCILY